MKEQTQKGKWNKFFPENHSESTLKGLKKSQKAFTMRENTFIMYDASQLLFLSTKSRQIFSPFSPIFALVSLTETNE